MIMETVSSLSTLGSNVVTLRPVTTGVTDCSLGDRYIEDYI